MKSSAENEGWTAGARGLDQTQLLAPATQIAASREEYLGQGRHDVGRRISEDQVELFISADVAGSLQHEFVQHTPEFLTLHDAGTSASMRLLSSLAGAAGARVQRLSIRRQGHGVALAVLQFVELPLSDGSPVRIYSTDFSADAAIRAQVARVLLAFSRLGVLLVGELPPHALMGQLAPLREAMERGPWPNRELLMVPLGSGAALASKAAQLSGVSRVAVQVTPQGSNPRQAWNFISGAWNRLQGLQTGGRALQTEIALAVPAPTPSVQEAQTEPMPLQPAPVAPRSPYPYDAPTAMPVPGGVRWQPYAERCAQIKGVVACCVFDMHSLEPLAQSGAATPPAGRLAQQGAALLTQVSEAVRALGLGPARPEATVSTATHHLLLRPVPGHPGVAVHLVLLVSSGNPTLARLQLERIELPG